jgi:integrase
MAWQSSGTPGVRFREHPTRKHGIKKDRYFAIYYKVNGVRHEEALGWATEGWTAQRATAQLAKLKEAHRLGEGPASLREKREAEEERRREVEALAEREARERITLPAFFETEYLPGAKLTLKADSVRKMEEHVRNWIAPAMGRIPMRDIRQFHLERLRANLAAAGRSPRTMQYVFATLRRVWNKARDKGYPLGPSPTKALDLPRVSNERQRYLSTEDADALLSALSERSPQTAHMSLLALDCGLRFSEVASLTWGCVQMNNNRLLILNAKGDKDRSVPMTRRVRELLAALEGGKPNELVFKSTTGGRIGKITKTFDAVVAELGLNADIDDPKLRFSFHALRHTFASNLVAAGVDLYRVQRLLGHSGPQMTQRYSHVSDQALEDAITRMEEHQTEPRNSDINNHIRQAREE